MEIPGTQKLDTSQVPASGPANELFCFNISDLTGAHLENFVAGLDQHLPAFVFSKTTLEQYEDWVSRGATRKTPLDRAKEFLQKTQEDRTSDSGELGEFLLYLFAREVKGAHKVVSKIQSRGSTTMTLPGRDGLFVAKDENDDIYLLLGEAKMKPDSNDALREAQGDMNAFWDAGTVRHEINLASANLRTELDSNNADLYEAYFIDDDPKHASLKYKNIIFVGYSLVALADLLRGATTATDFQQSVITDLQRCFRNQATLITASPHPSIYCFVPFESIDDARQEFARRHSLTL